MSKIFEHTNEGKRFLIIGCLPEDAKHIRFIDGMLYYSTDRFKGCSKHVLPAGEWDIHSVTNTMTEEQAHEVVPFYTETEYPEYGYPYDYVVYFDGADSPLEGLPYLITSLGGDPKKNYVILQNKEK